MISHYRDTSMDFSVQCHSAIVFPMIVGYFTQIFHAKNILKGLSSHVCISKEVTVSSCVWFQMDILIPAWISNHMPNKVWDKITYPFPNFNGCTVVVWERISNFTTHFTMDVIIIHAGIQVNPCLWKGPLQITIRAVPINAPAESGRTIVLPVRIHFKF